MASAPQQPAGFLQVDVDGLWAVRACYRRPERNSFSEDPCWSEGAERLVRLFREYEIPAAFFLVGRDLELDWKQEAAARWLAQGFELGNHSYTHRIGLTRMPLGYIYQEIRRTDEALKAVGAEPRGFRSPGYDVDARVLRALRRLGYAYDASVLPTYLSPALRLADAWLSRALDRKKRQFGRFSYGRAPRRPYFPRVHSLRKPSPSNTGLLEIPVGVTPWLRSPLTAASLFPLSQKQLARLFSRLASKGRPVLLLLHAIDGVDCSEPIVFDERRPSLGGFSLDSEEKERRLRAILTEFALRFDIQRADRFAEAALLRNSP